MTFLSIPANEIDDVQEPQVIRTEEEVKLAITDAKADNNKHGAPYVLIRFAAIDVEHADSKTFTKYFSVPTNEMEKDKYNNALRSLKYFYEAFEIDYSSGVELEQLVHAEGWALLGVDEQEDTDYGPQNYVKRFVAPGQ